jgi:hypothetical protein
VLPIHAAMFPTAPTPLSVNDPAAMSSPSCTHTDCTVPSSAKFAPTGRQSAPSHCAMLLSSTG